MKRILLVVRRLEVGGIEKVTINLANALASLGHEVHILCLKERKKRFTLKPIPDVYVHSVNFSRINKMTGIGLIYHFLTRAFLVHVFRKSGFVWHGLYAGWYLKVFIRILERRFGFIDEIIYRGEVAFAASWTFKDSRAYQVIESVPEPPSRGSLDRWYTKLLYGDKKTIAVSTGVRDLLERKLTAYKINPKSLQVISNPCPIEEIQALAEIPTSTPDKPYIVHVARLSPEKNQTLLIRAYHQAAPQEKLVIVGSGKEESRLRGLVKQLGLDKKVTFVGLQKNPYPWMKHARLFVLSSLKEAFGLVIVESLACGTPVVAVDCPGGIRDILIEEQAKLIAKPTVEDLAMKIREGLKWSISIKPAWVQRYDAKTIAERFIALP